MSSEPRKKAFAYETKEALLNAFTDMFGIQSTVSSTVLPYEDAKMKVLEYLKQAGDRKVTVTDLAKNLNFDTVSTAVILRDLREKGSIESAGSATKKLQHVSKQEAKEIEPDKFKEADPFILRNHQKTRCRQFNLVSRRRYNSRKEKRLIRGHLFRKCESVQPKSEEQR